MTWSRACWESAIGPLPSSGRRPWTDSDLRDSAGRFAELSRRACKRDGACGAASGRCATTARVCCCPANGRASSRSQRRRRRSVSAPSTRRCCISWRKARGRTRWCWPRCARWCCRKIERHGPIEAWIIDDTGFPKHGAHSVGVTHQYCGELGKQENCQVAVSLSIANHHASLPVAYRLYLPKSWAEDKKRRRKAGVPDAIAFQTKPKIALDQLARACAADLPRGVVLMDSAYGTDASLRRGAESLASTIRPPSTRGRWSKAARRQGQDDGRGAGRAVCLSARGKRSRGAKAQPSPCARALRVCVCAPAARAARQRARGMAAGRVAEGRDGANQILALVRCRGTSPSTASSTSP